jgi:hypothetical protein
MIDIRAVWGKLFCILFFENIRELGVFEGNLRLDGVNLYRR